MQFFLDGNDPADPAARRRRAPAGGHRRQDEAEAGRTSPDRRARRTTTDVYGATFDALNICELNVQWNSKPTASFKLADTASGRGVRLELPVRRRPRATACPQPGHHGPRPVPRHPVVPAAADLAARLPELQGLRDDGDRPVGRGRPAVAGDAVVRDPACERRVLRLPAGHLHPGDGIHRWMGSVAHGQEGQHRAGLQRRRTATDRLSRASATRDGSPATRWDR